MSQGQDEIRRVPLGGLGTGAVEVCSDGRFRNLSINDTRRVGTRIPVAPHSFLAVRASRGDEHYVRRLQTAGTGPDSPHLLPRDGLQFRGNYPQVDFQVTERDAPVEVCWSACAAMVPYDYDASSLPVVFFAVKIRNTSDAQLDVSAALNWENTCGVGGAEPQSSPPPVVPEVILSEAAWERLTGAADTDHERRLSASSGHIETTEQRVFHPGEIGPNGLVYGTVQQMQAGEFGQYCVATPWRFEYETSLVIWDPTEPASARRFWDAFTRDGRFIDEPGPEVPRCGAVSNRFSLEPGASQRVDFVVSWYGTPRGVADREAGAYYTNAFQDARDVARVGLDRRTYYHAAVAAWHQRVAAPEVPRTLARDLFAACEAFSSNTVYTREGRFHFSESPDASSGVPSRARWFWSMCLLLFYPRLERDALDRLSKTFEAPESGTGPTAADVEQCAYLVAMVYRDYRYGGSLSFFAGVAPRLQEIMAGLLAQDKDLDGFPDIQHEAPGLDGLSARGLNAITAGLWLVALRVYERIAERQHFSDAGLYRRAFERAVRTYDHYFWNREHGYYTLYPDPGLDRVPEGSLSAICHVGQLVPIWIASFLGVPEAFSRSRVARVFEAIETHNLVDDRLLRCALPGGTPASPQEAADTRLIVAYVCAKAQRDPATGVVALYERIAGHLPANDGADSDPGNRHLAPLALWNLLVASPAAQFRLGEKKLVLHTEFQSPGQQVTHSLVTPNGFGAVTVCVGEEAPLQCDVRFEMDVPQGLAAIAITLAGERGRFQAAIDVGDGPQPVPCRVESASETTTRVVVEIPGNQSTAGFSLTLTEAATDAAAQPSKKQWIPPWFRR